MASKNDLVAEDNGSYTLSFAKDSIPLLLEEKDIPSIIGPEEKDFLVKYVGVAEDDIVPHIVKARSEAWQSGLKYPSINALTWVRPYLSIHPARDEVLRRLRDGQSILDCGCMFAPDMRYLAYRGAPSENIHGFDVEPSFIAASYNYYRDRSKFHAKLITADFFNDSDNAPLKQLEGKMDIIWAAKFVHLFDRQMQIEVLVQLVKYLKPKPGSMLCASHNGLPNAQEVNVTQPEGGSVLRTPTFLMGNKETSKEIWAEVERRSESKWDFACELIDLRTIGWHKEDGSVRAKMTGHTLQWTAVRL